jgi:pimeloyl-ACP methyl ester carboxylesterase
MSSLFTILLACTIQQAPVEMRFKQVFPDHVNGRMERSLGQGQAVLLVHGLKIHPLQGGLASRAEFHNWQEPRSHLVKALAKGADVFALSYSQTADLDAISRAPGLVDAVEKMRSLGYAEIVLVGHSAGGVLARLFVEDHPYAPVTKVVQVCAPNLGSSWAQAEAKLQKVQGPFLQSLTKPWRQTISQERSGRRIPPRVQFLCVMGTVGPLGDGLVSCRSQWPEELQNQGIPVVRLATTHFVVMHSKKTAVQLADLIQRDYPRWGPREVQAARASMLLKTPH